MIRETNVWKRKGVITGRIVSVTAALLLAFLLLLIAGCAAVSQQAGRDMAAFPEKDFAPAPAPPPMPAMVQAPERALAPIAEDGAAVEESLMLAEEPAPGSIGERHIIKNADLHLEVLDIDQSIAELQKKIEQAGGYVFSRQIYSIDEERQGGNVSLRVPVDRFDALLAGIRDLGELKSENVYTDDVTMQYIDLEARITNLAAQEKRLRELLEKAEKIEDIMSVERELGRIRGELESLEGSFRHLRERVRYSAINIHLEERDIRTLAVEDDFATFGERLSALLLLNANRFLEGLSGIIIVAIGSLPIIVPSLIILLVLWKVLAVALRKARNKRRSEKQRSA